MFTGLVEEMGVLRDITRGADSAKLAIGANAVTEAVRLGDSIAVNGVCLTVVQFGRGYFVVDAMAETVAKTNLSFLKPGDRVNLERALKMGDRLGGHMVSGHVDGVGTISRRETLDIAILISIKAPEEVIKYTVKKGSIAIDGISLTVVDVGEDSLQVSLIPHTAHMTTLGFKRVGDKANLEVDIIGKYVESMVRRYLSSKDVSKGSGRDSARGVTEKFLADNGFM